MLLENMSKAELVIAFILGKISVFKVIYIFDVYSIGSVILTLFYFIVQPIRMFFSQKCAIKCNKIIIIICNCGTKSSFWVL